MNQDKVKKIFEIFKRNNPKPMTELNFSSNFELLIAVMLSAQATDKSVNKATGELFKKANTPREILNLGEQQLKNYIKTIGLYNSKAKNILKTCEILEEKYNGKVPEAREALTCLPGVGRKTANVILNTAFGQPTIAVDTHILRVSNRIGITQTKNPLQTEKALYEIIPKEYQQDAHHWLILHGRYICVARKPKCYTCNIVKYCEYEEKNLQPPHKNHL